MAKIKIDDIPDLEQIPATKAKVKFGELLHETSVNDKRFVVNRQGKPVSVILSYREYLKIISENKK